MTLPVTLPRTSSFEAFVTYANSIPMLTIEKETEFFLEYQKSDSLDAAQKLILPHLRFVAYIARGFKGYGLPLEDLVQEGTVGLMKSVKKFNVDYGVKLSSFAVHYIKAEMQEYVLKNWRLVKSATTKARRKIFFNLRKLKNKTEWISGGERKLIAEKLNVSEVDVDFMEMQMSQTDKSFDAPAKATDDGSASAFGDLMMDKSESTSEMVVKSDFKAKALSQVRRSLVDLDCRSRDIIERKWLSEENPTLKILAAEYGISKERVRQIEKQAILKIKGDVAFLIA